MLFYLNKCDDNNEKKYALLEEDNWDDWYEYSTMYSLYFIEKGKSEYIGKLKIGQFNMHKNQRRPKLPKKFESLKDEFFSLGQDITYYQELNLLGEDTRFEILNALQDISLLPQVYDLALSERVTTNSLLRSVSRKSITGQYRRLSKGDANLTPYNFSYIGPKIAGSEKIELTFEVLPDSNPPSNIHVLIGRNSVGKTHIINNMVNSLVANDHKRKDQGFFEFISEEDSKEDLFANVVSVSFSAFDSAEPLQERRNKAEGIDYTYIGLKKIAKSDKTNGTQECLPKSPDNLKYEFANSLNAIFSSSKTTRWLRVIEMLSTDPIFEEANVPSILKWEEDLYDHTGIKIEDAKHKITDINKEIKSRAQKFFHRLSSGHKIVLLTLTQLVETVEEKTLVLLDEPEAHLHPPLLSAFIRALSDLLKGRNAVAIVATHSPIILQEVPSKCVWKLRRNGQNVYFSRTELETFGENIGALTREIFELEVTYSGFYKLLRESVNKFGDYEQVIEDFNSEVGMEARAIIKTLLLELEEEE